MMGLDFIRRTSGKPFRKAWKDGLNRLTSPTLFPVAVDSSRVVTASLLPNGTLEPGQDVIIQVLDSMLTVCDGNRPVALVENPPTGVLSAVRDAAGIAVGTIERLGSFGDTVEVRIR